MEILLNLELVRAEHALTNAVWALEANIVATIFGTTMRFFVRQILLAGISVWFKFYVRLIKWQKEYDWGREKIGGGPPSSLNRLFWGEHLSGSEDTASMRGNFQKLSHWMKRFLNPYLRYLIRKSYLQHFPDPTSRGKRRPHQSHSPRAVQQ